MQASIASFLDLSKNIGMPKSHVIFVPTLEQGYFTLLLSHYIHKMIESGKTHLLYLETEIDVWKEPLLKLKPLGIEGRALKVDSEGVLTGESFLKQSALWRRSSLFSFSWAHPLTGVIQPLEDLVAAAQQEQIEVHVDLSAAFGKLELVASAVEKGSLSLALPPPFGSYTALFFQNHKEASCIDFPPPIPKAELGFQFAKKVEEIKTDLEQYAFEISSYKQTLQEKLLSLGATVFFEESYSLPNIVVFGFEGVHGELLSSMLSVPMGIKIYATKPLSHAIQAIGISSLKAYSAISCILDVTVTQEIVDSLIENVRQTWVVLSKFKMRKETWK